LLPIAVLAVVADLRCTDTLAVLASIIERTGVGIVAGCACERRVRADTRRGVADVCIVALIRLGADHRVRPRADARQAGIRLGAEVAIVAGGVVGLVRVRADTRWCIASAGVVALIERGADDRRTGASTVLA